MRILKTAHTYNRGHISEAFFYTTELDCEKFEKLIKYFIFIKTNL